MTYLDFFTAPAIMTSIGLLFGVILAVAYHYLKVDEDPRISETEGLLPGTNCGACGEPGCLPFAIKLVAGDVAPSGCTVASEDDIDNLSEFLGVDAGDQEKIVARLRCAGGKGQAFQVAEYQGFESCRAAAVISGGGKGCSWGCLGLADCEVACSFDVIHMNDNGLPVVDSANCTACSDCVDICPKDLFELKPAAEKLYVQCNIPLEGESVTALCSAGCDGCAKCVADAPEGLMHMENELPIVDYSSGLFTTDRTTKKAVERCPTQAIQWLETDQFLEHPEETNRYSQY
ncbi:MAG: RnfABCDGE type electron transport complex subunit B [gamma proteobacterium symbiont of Taylorina sp.]|nr:RnfABCDGE type electron transport complex subunit B [gamma proteobacterium symbiont of Taylorina sp.]